MRKLPPDVAILAALCLVLLIPFLVTGRTILPFDWLGLTPSGPYHYSEPRQPHCYTLDPTGSLGGDIGFIAYTAESLRHGVIPFWNPFQSLGAPFLAEGGSQVSYPLNWLHTIVPIEYWDVLRFLHFFLASWFVYLFAKECGLERWPALLAGACVYAQGFFQGFLAMNMILAAFTWLPLLLYGVERYLNGKRSRASFLAVSGGTFLLATGSHPGLAIVCAVTVVTYVSLRCLSERSSRGLIAMLLPFTAGLLCSAPTWVPFLQNALATRDTLGLAPEHVTLRLLPSLFFPFVYSSLYSPVFGSTAVSLGSRCYGWMPAGVVFLALAGIVAAIFRRDRRMLTLSMIVVWLLLWMMDIPPFNLLRHLSFTRRLTLAYLLCAIQLLVCVLTGYGVSVFLSARKRELAVTAGVWTTFVGANFAIVASVLRAAGPTTERACVLAGLVPNAAWAIAVPLLLYGSLLVTRRTGLQNASVAVSFAIIAGSAVAFFPSGATYEVLLMTRIGVLLAVVVCVGITQLYRSLERSVWVTVAALLVLNLALVAKYPGWPKRTDPFAEPPFVHYLKQLPQSGREYAMRAILFPDLASKLALPSINELTTLLPRSTMRFMSRYADTCQNPAMFWGIRQCPDGPLMQIIERRRVWDYLGIRDVLGPSADEIKAAMAALGPLASDFIAVEVRGAVHFPVEVKGGTSRVEVLISTAGRINRGPLRFELTNAAGETVISKQLDGAKLPVQEWAVFTREGGAGIPAGNYTAQITFKPANAESAIVLWKDQVRPGSYRHRVPVENAGFKLAFYSSEDQVPVWSNPSVKSLVYVAPRNEPALGAVDAQAKLVAQPDLHHSVYLEPGIQGCADNPSFPEGQEVSQVKTIAITPNRVAVSLEARSSGTLVYVGSYAKGWMARIDGKSAGTFRANGTFLGTCLTSPGFHQVTFEYRTPSWYPCLAAAAAGLVLAAFGLLAASGRPARYFQSATKILNS